MQDAYDRMQPACNHTPPAYDRSMQPAYDRMQAAYDCMQAAHIPSVAPALDIQSVIRLN